MADGIKTIMIEHPLAGSYTVELLGTGNGPYTLDWKTSTGSGTPTLQSIKDTISVGQRRTYQFSLTAAPAVAPSIVAHPANQEVSAGQAAVFSVAANATVTPLPSYQWQVSTNGGATWTNLSSAAPYADSTTPTLTIGSTQTSQNGYRYRAVVSNSAGTATSNAATLTVAPGNGSFLTPDRTSLAFAAVSNGATFTSRTPAQTVRLTLSGPGPVTWTATPSQPWLTVSPASGSGSGALTVNVGFDGAVAGQGSATASIAFTTTGTSGTVGPVNVSLAVTSSSGTKSVPFGVVDTPSESAILSGSVAITGWTLDNVGVKRVELWRGPLAGETTPTFSSTPDDPRNGKIFIGNAVFTEGARPDVETLNPTTPNASKGGWGYLLLTQGLWDQGNGVYFITAYAFDEEDNIAKIGTKALSINNRSGTKPFGSIDTPTIGGDPGTSPNFGWALTPKVNGVATCKIPSSGVQVSIDSGPLQPVVYGDVRTDIAGAFPGYSNSAAAGGHFIFDWSTLSNGPHTIGWLVTDDCGRADGIGSRFFNVTTGSSVVAAPDVTSFRLKAEATERESGAKTESNEPITVAYGYGGELPRVVEPGLDGARTVEIKQGDRIELRMPPGFGAASQILGGQPRRLPLGSTWDAASGTFYWQPAPGFLGPFRLVFGSGSERISVRVVIKP